VPVEASSGASQTGDVVEFNRNRYFMIGVLLFLLGLQFRMVESFVLNETSTRVLARMTRGSKYASASNMGQAMYMNVAAPKKQFKPPTWIGFALLSAGGVICLHALVLPKANT
jgi:hypothetical protein